MPYLPPTEALSGPFADLASIRERMGPPPWRVGLVGEPGARVVLLCWAPGFATVPHRHPGAEELFLVIEGRARFSIGDAPEREIGPGELVLARRDEIHAITVPEDGPELVLLAAVAPNEDRPDEAIESEGLERGSAAVERPR
jgi:quercetin dioxygenase-like cupin family protein